MFTGDFLSVFACAVLVLVHAVVYRSNLNGGVAGIRSDREEKDDS